MFGALYSGRHRPHHIALKLTGFFADESLAAINRTKEIGIRKILGASFSVLFGLLSKDFLKLVVIAFLIASPISWYLSNKWLEHYAYRIHVSWWVFTITGVLIMVIAPTNHESPRHQNSLGKSGRDLTLGMMNIFVSMQKLS
jgi:hypothetical protein